MILTHSRSQDQRRVLAQSSDVTQRAGHSIGGREQEGHRNFPPWPKSGELYSPETIPIYSTAVINDAHSTLWDLLLNFRA